MLEMSIVCFGLIGLLELWRRFLGRTRVMPRWISGVTWGFFGLSITLIAIAWFMVERMFAGMQVGTDKVALVARGISFGLNFTATAIAALGVVIVMLGVSQMTLRKK